MDKHEYRAKTEQMLQYMSQKSYKQAADIADGIDWRRVKNVSMLCAVSEIYEYNGEYEKSRDVLFLAYERAPESRKIVYRLSTLALKMDEIQEAVDCYEEFVNLAPKDSNQYVLKYKILKSQKAPLKEQIEALKEFKEKEYIEKWAYELAVLYHKAGMMEECLTECDDMILWFNEGKYVHKALELKMRYKPLTPLQQEKYNLMNQSSKKVAEVVEEPAAADEPEVMDEPAAVEEPATVEKQESAEESVEKIKEDAASEKRQAPTLSIEEMLQEWEAKQKENAQLIQAECKKAEQEKQEKDEASKVSENESKESILSDDIRRLMEELESEAADIAIQKAKQDVVEEPVKKPVLSVIGAMLEPVIGSAFESGEDEMNEEAGLPEDDEQAETDLEVKPEVSVVAPEMTESAEEAIVEIEEVSTVDLEKVVSHAFESTMMDSSVIEEAPGIKLGDTQSMTAVAKALKNAALVEEQESAAEKKPIAEKVVRQSAAQDRPKSQNPYDTGFIVQGRYDLESQSEVGLKAGLTEEQKKLFSYFVPVHGMSEQLVGVLENDKKCRDRYGTSRIGNLLIIGRKGSGKTVLAVDVVKAIQKARKLKQGKVGIVTADSLNKKDVTDILTKLHGGAIIIEKASHLSRRSIEDMCDVMEGQTGELLVVLEDERKPLERMLEQYPQFKKKFTSKLELPVFINDELVTFGQTYAKENGYKIDEMGILALYSRIDMLQRDEYIVTVSDVKEILDEAIDNSQRASFKKMMKKFFGKNKDESERIILKEEDFK